VFVMDIGRRWGKTTLCVLIRMEDCLRNPGSAYRYVTAFQKDIEEVVDDVSRVLLDTCPPEHRPEYRGSRGAQSAGFYFPNGSVLKLAGLDKNPNALRGRASDGDTLSEAVFIDKLEASIKNVLYAQYQGKAHARMILESSAPEEPDSRYDKVFVADAKKRGAYFFGTIEDNTSLPDAEREEFIRAAGGRGDHDCDREYFGIRNRNPDTVLVPEFSETRHVLRVPVPEYACGYVTMDPGMSDLLALVFCYWHEELQKLVVLRSWAAYNAGTHDIAEQIRTIESELWGTRYVGDSDLEPGTIERKWWDGKRLQQQPYLRVTDTDLRLAQDLWTEHQLQFSLAAKNEIQIDGRNHSTLQLLRTWHRDDKIIYDPDCGPVLDHVRHGKWNERRTDWARDDEYGHFACLAALKYLPRHVEQNRSAQPPYWFLNPDAARLPFHQDQPGERAQLPEKSLRAMQRAFGGKPKWKR